MKIKRLKGRDRIQELFLSGATLSVFPLLIRYKIGSTAGDCYVGVSVPKKKISKAVTRNRIKRQLWTLIRNNPDFLSKPLHGKQAAIMFIYNQSDTLTASQMEKHFKGLLSRWATL